MKNYFLLNATIGRFYARDKKPVEALGYLERAIQQTDSVLEKKFIRNIIGSLGNESGFST